MSSTLKNDNNNNGSSNPLLDHSFLDPFQTNLTSTANDDQDILDEFLDQRVYDSIGTNTPISGSQIKLEHHDLIDSLFPMVVDQSNNHTSNTTNATNSNITGFLQNHQKNGGSINNLNHNSNSNGNSNNDYLYLDTLNFQANSSITNHNDDSHNHTTNNNSIYTSPLEQKLLNNESPLSTYSNGSQDIHNHHKHSNNLLQQQQQQQPSFNFNGNNQNLSQLSDYDYVRDELSKLKFGNHFMNVCPPSIDIPDPSYLDFSAEALSKLPYNLQISNLPNYSRVETQIKLKFALSPPPPQVLLHIPQDLISKNKFCLNENINDLSPKLKDNLLFLDAYVLTSDLKKSCNICSRCIKREQKRASRRKTGFDLSSSNNDNNATDNQDNNQDNLSTSYNTPNNNSSSVVKNNPNSWADEKMMKKGIIFNCKEIVSFPPPTGLNNDSSKSLELSARIICYCRHHKESDGFKLLFLVKNSEGIVVGKQLSSPIMIMDRKKNTASIRNENSMPNSVAGSSTNLQGLNTSFGSESSSSRITKSNPIATTTTNTNSSTNHNGQEIKKKKSNSDSDDLDMDNDNENDNDDKSPLQHLSPNSIDESASEIQTNTDTDGRSLKRKKLSIDDSFNSSTNPMFNGSSNGFSPLSNSDTNTSTTNHNLLIKPQHNNNSNGMLLHAPNFSNGLSPLTHPQSQSLSNGLSSNDTNNIQASNMPYIQRIIPAQGPIRGGIEVTLLGFNFRPGLKVKFGANMALATHCWSDTTIVTYLPAAAQPGQVLVSFENHDNSDLIVNSAQQQQQIFTYTDDTDRQLIELALQIVGLKMNGKLEDARNIAKRIVGSDASGGKSPHNSTSGSISNTDQLTQLNHTNNSVQADNDWFNSAHKAVQELSNPNLSTEVILINFLSLVDLPNCPIIIPNWQLSNKLGQSLLHFATLKNYGQLIKFLITHGCKIDLQDNQGLTPLFLASLCGHRDLINIFIDCKSNWNLKLKNDKYLKDYCDLNVLDIFNNLEEIHNSGNERDFADIINNAHNSRSSINTNPNHNDNANEITNDDKLNKSVSLDSLNSMFAMNYGRHISKMVMQENSSASNAINLNFFDNNAIRREYFETPNSNNNQDSNSEFADSEYESGDYDDFDNYDDEEEESFNDDYYDDEDDYDEEEIINEEDMEADDEREQDNEEEEDAFIETESLTSNSTILLSGSGATSPTSTAASSGGEEEPESSIQAGIWQKVKNVFTTETEEENLPSYYDLFPFGPSAFNSKPKTQMERSLNEGSSSTTTNTNDVTSTSTIGESTDPQDDAGISSDSSEDMVISYINHPRKAVENDKMLLFFWIPALIVICGLFFMVSVMGYRFEFIESIKSLIRTTIGNLMVGNERIGRVFKTETNNVIAETKRLIVNV